MHLVRRILPRVASPAQRRRFPLALWDPLSYVVLLYWAFFYPQAVREYVAVWAPEDRALRGLALLRYGQRRDLIVQTGVIAVFTALVLSFIIGEYFLAISWTGVLFGVTLGLLFGLVSGLAIDLAAGVVLTIISVIVGGVLSGLALGQMVVWAKLLPSLTGLFMVGAALGVVISAALAVRGGVADSWWGILAGMSTYGIMLGLVYGVASGVLDAFGRFLDAPPAVAAALLVRIVLVRSALGLLRGLVFASGLSIAMLRPDSWFLGVLGLWGVSRGRASAAHVSPLALPLLRGALRDVLRRDWPLGVRWLERLLRTTMQFTPALAAVNDVLGAMSPQDALAALSDLAEAPYDWNLIRFCSASLPATVNTQMVQECHILPGVWKQRFLAGWDTALRRDAPNHAIAAGLWRLYQLAPLDAAQDFAALRRYLPTAEGAYKLARSLGAAQSANDLAAIAALVERDEFKVSKSSVSPATAQPYPNPMLWQALALLQRAALDAHMIQVASSRISRSQAHSRSLAALVALRGRLDQAPAVWRGLLAAIVDTWERALVGAAEKVAEIATLATMPNPYTVGNPVIGRGYMGRERITRDLAAKWSGDQAPPLVVLYGQRRVGKTSVLHNLKDHFGSNTLLAYTNLAVLGDAPRGVSSLLLALEDSIAAAMRQAGRQAPAPDAIALEDQPYRGFERYLRAAQAASDGGRLLLVLDEGEYLEDWISRGLVPADLIQFLRGCAQVDPTLSFILAGLPHLNEIAARYVEPFLGVVPVKVGLLDRADTLRLLMNPSDQFPLEYEPEAAEAVWELTAGHPYLVQLLGHLLVERYNANAPTLGHPTDLTVRLGDVRQVADSPLFFQMGRYYFASVWDQAQHPPAGQQAVLRALARHAKGLDAPALAARTGLDDVRLRAALAALERDDVLVEAQGVWRYAIELLRLWMLRPA